MSAPTVSAGAGVESLPGSLPEAVTSSPREALHPAGRWATLAEVFRFEVRYHLRQPLFWIVTLCFFALTFMAETTDAVSVGGGIGNVHRNAPAVIFVMMLTMSVIGVFVSTAYVASSAQRDFEYGTHELFLSKPLPKTHYLLGRYAGSLLVAFLVFLGPALGILVGSFMPWLEKERLGPVQPGAYLFALFVLVLPNLVLTGSLFFLLALRTRSLLGTYLGVVGFLALYFTALVMFGDFQYRKVAAWIDPFGGAAIDEATRYWTVIERNGRLPDLAGTLLWNRVAVTALGLVILVAAIASFRPAASVGRLPQRRRRAVALDQPAVAVPQTVTTPVVVRRFDAATSRSQLLHQMRLEVRTVLRGIPFIVLLAFGVLNVLGGSGFLNDFWGTKVYPVTHLMLDLLGGNFVFLLYVIVTFYAGELIWRERSLRLAEVHDAMPVPNWVPLVAKLTALGTVIVAFLLCGALTTVGIQLARGYTRIQPGLYLEGLGLAVMPFLLAAVLAVFLQVVADGKLIGYLLMILWMISEAVLSALHFDHNLYRYGGLPEYRYSEMNGYGHFLPAVGWFALYWTFGAGMLLVLAHVLWVRGTGHTWRERLRLAGARFRGPVRLLFAFALAGFAATGGWIYYNTCVLNPYLPSDVRQGLQADYEKKYRKDLAIALPRVVAVETAVDIYPADRRLAVRGRYSLVNKTGAPIVRLPITTNSRVHTQLELPPHEVEVEDRKLGYAVYRLDPPLAPGAALELPFTVDVEQRGFVNGDSDLHLVYNGTFFNDAHYMPMIGYDARRELDDRNVRRKHDLPPVIRMPKIDDVGEHGNNYLTRDSDWIRFATTVSTSADQVALAPGYLTREWTTGGRRYFRYEMDAPILHFYSYLSARWKVTRDSWRGPGAPAGGVAIEVYHLPEHEYNVSRMIESTKKTLAYCTAAFGPYQHREVRIVEFPRYATFAQSFPTTIPYSESIGFIADLRDPEKIDYAFYVTAHEVAHQWWGHQVIGANVQGATLLSETLAQYTALLVMEKEYGATAMRKFLKYELDRYLSDRGGELVEEMPLELVEDQGYIHYRKGSVVMYALRDAIGEDAVNRALRRLVQDEGFQAAPYPDSRELIRYLRAEAPPEQQAFITDLFERITLFENRAVDAKAHRRADGKWVVDMTLAARKLYADGQGRETEAPLDAWVDVGVLGPEPKDKSKPQPVLYLSKRRITSAETKVEVVVASEPYEAGIDPLNKLVDRNSDDNRTKVTIETGKGG
jgi:ABC-type transport system involved in multi-copper enzyme maturation permease subunit